MALPAQNESPTGTQTEPFGDWIARERQARGLSKAALGAAIGYSGSAVFQWERGIIQPLDRTRKTLHDFFARNPAPAAAAPSTGVPA